MTLGPAGLGLGGGMWAELTPEFFNLANRLYNVHFS